MASPAAAAPSTTDAHFSSPAAHPIATSKPPSPPAPRPLSTLRSLIDGVDAKIVALLNERARLVIEVGKRKIADGSPVYAPHREQAVLTKVLQLNSGPLLNVRGRWEGLGRPCWPPV